MKVKRSVLEQMIKEELRSHLHELLEAPKGAGVVDADDERKGEKEKEPPAGAKAPKPPGAGPKPPVAPGGEPEEPEELPVGDEPAADPELEKDAAEDDSEEDAAELTGGKVADQITGKTIQSITMEPKSKTLPGAQELVITFREIPDPLKVLVTKQGDVKFFFRGIHNEV